MRRATWLSLLLASCAAREGTVLLTVDTRDAAGDAALAGADAALELDAHVPDAGEGATDSQVASADASADAATPSGLMGRCRIEGAASGFYESFAGSALSDTWLLAHGVHSFAGSAPRGGFVRENVALSAGALVLTVRGDRYSGPVRGIAADGSGLPDGRRTAAAVVTRDLFASGTYQMQGQLVAPPGVEVAMWVMADDDRAGGIDIATPGSSELGDGGVPSYAAVRMRARSSRSAGELNQFKLAQSLDDGQSHILRFDWYTVGAPTAQFWVDDSPRWTATAQVPTGETRRLWIVAWIPDPAVADFESAEIRVDNVFVTPFGNDGDRCTAGSFASQGLGLPR